MATKVKLNRARLAFASIFEPRAQLNGKLKRDANFIIDAAQAREVSAAIRAECNEAWGARSEEILKTIETNRKCLRSGDTKINDSGEIYDGFEGMYYVSAKSGGPVLILDRDGKTELSAIDGRPYSGCYVNAVIEIYTVKGQKQGGFGVFADLKGVQFVEDGDAFSGGTPASPDDFDDLSADATAPVTAPVTAGADPLV